MDLRETYYLVPTLVEGTSDGKLRLRGVFAEADRPTANRRIYSRRLWEREIAKLQPKMEARGLFGELDHPTTPSTMLQRSSHLITNMYIDPNGQIIGEAEVLPNFHGGELKALCDAKCRIGISSRGVGSVQRNESGYDVVQEDFQLFTLDFVADPANAGAYPEIIRSESAPLTPPLTKVPQMEMNEATKSELKAELAKAISEAKAEIKREAREELLADPTVGGAKLTLESVKELLRPYLVTEDVNLAIAEKQDEVARLTRHMEEQRIQMEALQQDYERAANLAKQATFRLCFEQATYGDPDRNLIAKFVGDLDMYESIAEVKSKIDSIREDLEVRRQATRVQEEKLQAKLAEEAALRESERERVRMQESELRAESDKLRLVIDKQAMAIESFAVQLYIEERLRNHPRSAEIRGVMEAHDPRNRTEVDSIVEKFREPSRDSHMIESTRDNIRKHMGAPAAPVTPEVYSKLLKEERSGELSEVEHQFASLGLSISDIRLRTGI